VAGRLVAVVALLGLRDDAVAAPGRSGVGRVDRLLSGVGQRLAGNARIARAELAPVVLARLLALRSVLALAEHRELRLAGGAGLRLGRRAGHDGREGGGRD